MEETVRSSLPLSPMKGTVFIALIRAPSCRRKWESSVPLLTDSDWGGNVEGFVQQKQELHN